MQESRPSCSKPIELVRIAKRENQNDLGKSLDAIIEERGIKNPYATITKELGKKLVPLQVQRRNPVECSLDELIINKGPEPKSGNAIDGGKKKVLQLQKKNPLECSLDELMVKKEKPEPGKRKRDGINEEETSTSNGFENNGMDKYSLQKLFPYTPYRVITSLSERGMQIQVSTGRRKTIGDRSHMWRCQVVGEDGSIIGKSDSERKVVAREMACHQFLIALQKIHPEHDFPAYDIPDELFIDPKVFHWLARLGNERNVPIHHEVRLRTATKGKGGNAFNMYTCIYSVGGEEFMGESSDMEYAKLGAAKKAYESLSDRRLLSTIYFTGRQCIAEEEFDFNESELYHELPKSSTGPGKKKQESTGPGNKKQELVVKVTNDKREIGTKTSTRAPENDVKKEDEDEFLLREMISLYDDDRTDTGTIRIVADDLHGGRRKIFKAPPAGDELARHLESVRIACLNEDQNQAGMVMGVQEPRKPVGVSLHGLSSPPFKELTGLGHGRGRALNKFERYRRFAENDSFKSDESEDDD